MAVLAVANGIFRETVLVARLGESTAGLVSTGLLLTAIVVVAAVSFAWSPVTYSRRELVAVGAAWAAATIGFEFLVGYAEGVPPSVTLAQYDVLAGEVWILVPITLLLAPLLFGDLLRSRLSRLRSSAPSR